MAKLDIAKHYETINAASKLFLLNFGPAFTNTPEGHIETDIAGAASIAGLMLLRATVPNLIQYSPGTILLSDIHDAQKQVFDFMINVAYSMRLEYKTGWNTRVPKEHQPLFETVTLTHKLELPFYEACAQTGIAKDYHPYVAALTAMKLVAAGNEMKLLDLNIGKGLAFYYVVAGSKTAPYPLGEIVA